MKIIDIKDPGIPNKERLLIEVATTEDVGKYIVFDTEKTSAGRYRSKPNFAYWFPDKLVNAGDLVVLYTGPGVNTQTTNQKGSITHYFYWGLDKTIINNKGDGIVLIEANTWEFKTKEE